MTCADWDDSSDEFSPEIPFVRGEQTAFDISHLGVKNTFFTLQAPEHPEQRTRYASAPPRFAASQEVRLPTRIGANEMPPPKPHAPYPRKARRGRRARCTAPPPPRIVVDFSVPSRGSKNHFNGRQCKPCREYHQKGSCSSGRLCNFCHYDHEELVRPAQAAPTQHEVKVLSISDTLPWMSQSTSDTLPLMSSPKEATWGDYVSTASSSEQESGAWLSP